MLEKLSIYCVVLFSRTSIELCNKLFYFHHITNLKTNQAMQWIKNMLLLQVNTYNL